MNKVQLAEKLHELHVQKGMDTSKKHAEEGVDFVFDTITKTLTKGEEVSIAGFGIFLVKRSNARTARNPKTGEIVQVPAMNKPKFRAGKALKEAVK